MLVLTRKSNQSIMIGDDVEVTVLSVVGDKVRIGIQAPQDVPVFRTEIYEEIHRQGDGARTATGAAPAAGARPAAPSAVESVAGATAGDGERAEPARQAETAQATADTAAPAGESAEQ